MRDVGRANINETGRKSSFLVVTPVCSTAFYIKTDFPAIMGMAVGRLCWAGYICNVDVHEKHLVFFILSAGDSYISMIPYCSRYSRGLMPICFLKAVLK